MKTGIPPSDLETGNTSQSEEENPPLALDDGDWPECPNCHYKGKRWFGLCPQCGVADRPETDSPHALLSAEDNHDIRKQATSHEADFKALDASIDSLLSELLDLEVKERSLLNDTPKDILNTHEDVGFENRKGRAPITPRVRTTLEWILLSLLLLALLILGISAGLWAYMFFFH